MIMTGLSRLFPLNPNQTIRSELSCVRPSFPVPDTSPPGQEEGALTLLGLGSSGFDPWQLASDQRKRNANSLHVNINRLLFYDVRQRLRLRGGNERPDGDTCGL